MVFCDASDEKHAVIPGLGAKSRVSVSFIFTSPLNSLRKILVQKCHYNSAIMQSLRPLE